MPASVLPLLDLRVPAAVNRFGRHGQRLVTASGLPVVCAASAIALLVDSFAITEDGTGSRMVDAFAITDDGAGSVPLVALLGIALASVRWRPDRGQPPSRAVTLQSALALTTVGIGLIASIGRDQLTTSAALGPIITVAVISTYLALWGYRSLALLRTVTLLSTLTWAPVAGFAHDAIRSSLEQPSRLIYQRLAELPVFGVSDEPWRIFSAELHRGALVVLATLVLSVGANRWRMSGRTVIDITATVAGALLLHHAVILATPIDTYDETDAVMLVTNPALEIAIAAIAVLLLAVVRWRRGDVPRVAAAPSPEIADRDPFIFGTTSTTSSAVTALLLAGLTPLVVLVAVGA